MSPKKKERSEVEYLRGLVRELKSEVRHLKKEAGRSRKKVKQYENIIDEQQDAVEMDVEAVFEMPKPRCPECNGTQMDIFEIGVINSTRELHLCQECGFRKTYPKKK